MIRLGSLAGYLFEGPRLLGGWTARIDTRSAEPPARMRALATCRQRQPFGPFWSVFRLICL